MSMDEILARIAAAVREKPELAALLESDPKSAVTQIFRAAPAMEDGALGDDALDRVAGGTGGFTDAEIQQSLAQFLALRGNIDLTPWLNAPQSPLLGNMR